MDQSERKDTAQHALVYIGIGVAIVLLVILLWYAIDVFLLLFIGTLLAVMLRTPADWLAARTGWSEGLTLALVIAVLAVLVSVSGVLFGRAVLEQSWALTQQLPKVMDKARERLSQNELGKRFVEATEARHPETEMKFVGRGLRLVGSSFAALGSLVVVIFIGVFLAWEPRAYIDGFVKLFPQRRRKRAREVLYRTGAMLKRWLAGQLVLMGVVAVLTWVGLRLLGVPFALPLALLAGLLEFVPYIGPVAAAIPAVLVAFAEDARLALWTVLVYVAIQSLESYVLTPLIQHRAVYLPPALILFSQVVFGVTAGPLGIIVATPFAAALLVAVHLLYVQDVLGDSA